MKLSLFFRSQRGLTLVELMMTVAIIGVLAVLASMAFTRHTNKGKVAQLTQYALDVARAQEEYRSRNMGYFNPTTSQYAPTDTQWTNILGFHPTLPAGVEVHSQAGIGTTPVCSICQGVNPAGIAGDSWWYAVRVRQSLDNNAATFTTVVMNNDLPAPVVLNEGQ